MPTTSDVENFLSRQQIRVLRFNDPAPDSESAAKAVGCTVAEIAKSILFNVGGEPVLVVTCGDAKVKSSKIKRAMELTGKVRLSEPDEVFRHTGYVPGGVTPFLLPEELQVLLDSSLRRFPRVYPAAGDDHSAVPVTMEQLLELTGGKEVTVCDLASAMPDGKPAV